MSTTTQTTPEVTILTTAEKDKAAHIVMVPEGQPDSTPQAYVLRARIEGFPVTAICGYTWVPQENPEKRPVCSICLEIYQLPGHHREERNELPDA